MSNFGNRGSSSVLFGGRQWPTTTFFTQRSETSVLISKNVLETSVTIINSFSSSAHSKNELEFLAIDR